MPLGEGDGRELPKLEKREAKDGGKSAGEGQLMTTVPSVLEDLS